MPNIDDPDLHGGQLNPELYHHDGKLNPDLYHHDGGDDSPVRGVITRVGGGHEV